MFEYFYNDNGDLVCPHCENYVVLKTINPDGSINHHQNTMYYHYKKHEGPFTCQHCNKEYKNEFSLRDHMAEFHPTEGQTKETREVFVCPVPNCDHQSKTKGNRIPHFMRNHCGNAVAAYEIYDSETKTSTCSLCQKQCNSKASFIHHIAKCLVSRNLSPHPMLAWIL